LIVLEFFLDARQAAKQPNDQLQESYGPRAQMSFSDL
jgi:hypothetical protein